MTLGKLDRQPPRLSNVMIHRDFISPYTQAKQIGEVDRRLTSPLNSADIKRAKVYGRLFKSLINAMVKANIKKINIP